MTSLQPTESDFHDALGIQVANPEGRGDIWAIPLTSMFEEIGTLRVYADGRAVVTPVQGSGPIRIEALRNAATHILYGPSSVMYGTWHSHRRKSGKFEYIETKVSIPMGRR